MTTFSVPASEPCLPPAENPPLDCWLNVTGAGGLSTIWLAGTAGTSNGEAFGQAGTGGAGCDTAGALGTADGRKEINGGTGGRLTGSGTARGGPGRTAGGTQRGAGGGTPGRVRVRGLCGPQ